MVDIEQIKRLRSETSAPVMEVKRALEETGGDEEAAKKILSEKMLIKAAKKSTGRKASDGSVFSYVHSGGKIGALLSLFCETDFVARSEMFANLGKELCLQIASMNPKDRKDLLGQEYVRDPEKKVSDLVGEVSGTLGEKIEIGEFARYEI